MDIAYLIKHPEQLDRESLYDLRSLIALYPYYQTARLLLLQNLYILHDSSFNEELRNAALYISDRRVIFNLIEAAHYQLPSAKTEDRVISGEKSSKDENRTISLIDNFLDSIPEEEVMSDALGLLPLLDDISDDDHNRFTKRDVLDAMNMYQESYVTYSRAEVERVSGISVPPNKRNGRKQEQHIKIMNAIRDIEHPDGEWRNKDGRPEKSKIVEEWRKVHPDGRKVDCIRETGLSKPTVYKWWK